MHILAKIGIKLKIIITFSILMLLLVVILARTGYIFVRNIYLEQLNEHIGNITSLIVSDLDSKYFDLINSEAGNLATSHYERELNTYIERLALDNAFIFDKQLQIVVSAKPGISATRLQLNRKEISDLEPGKPVSSMPFKGENNIWYLWAFQRINNKYNLGVQEGVDKLARLDELSGSLQLLD